MCCWQNLLPDSEIVHPPFFLTPPANKPGELCRLKILVIEIGFPKNRDRLVPHQTQFQLLQIVKML